MTILNKATIQKLKNDFMRCYSKNVVYREVARCDGFPLFMATRNPEFNKYISWSAPKEEKDIFLPIDKLIREQNLNESVVLSICHKYTGEWMGVARLKEWKDGIEIGIFLHPNYWGRGVVFASGGPLLEVIVNSLPDLPVYIRIMKENERMKRLTDFYSFEKQEEISEEKHPVEGVFILEVYKLNKNIRTTYKNMGYF